MIRRIASAVLLSGALASATAAAPTTFTVNSTNDKADKTVGDGICADADGNCTLRAAIQEANAAPGTNTIAFAIPGAGVHTITPASSLPDIIDPVIIDGTTQPGYAGTPMIELNGASVAPANGLNILAGSSTVRGLAINRFGHAIVLLTGGSNVIQGNFIGIDPGGNTARPNSGDAIYVATTSNIIGGVGVGSRNVVSGNSSTGIAITGAGATGNSVEGNLIGTNASGTAKLGNAGNGIYVGSANNTIGGTAAGAGNLISGNTFPGIGITAGATGNQVQGNVIGLDITGTAKLGNASNGISIDMGSSNNTIGGTSPGARNVISGNDLPGIAIVGPDVTGNSILGNYIGTDVAGVNGLGNAQNGIYIRAPGNFVGSIASGGRNVIAGNGLPGIFLDTSDAHDNAVTGNFIGVSVNGTALANTKGVVVNSAPNNAIGGTLPGAGNVISGNTSYGVEIRNAGATGNKVQGNWIGTNTGNANRHNGGDGVLVNATTDNLIGGTAVGASNVIAFNAGNGITVTGVTAVRNSIRANSIHDNAGLGIDLGGDGVTPNDPGDGDTGPNDLMNFPEGVTAVYDKSKNQTLLRGHLDTPNPATVQIDLYANSKKDASDHGQGEKYLASTTPDTNGYFCLTWSGTLPFVTGTPASGTVVPPPWVSATATNSAGSTSEFSSTKNDVELIALEVNQAVQDWTNSLPLIEKKTTYVRAHVQTSDPAAGPIAVSLQLRGFRTGVELSGSPLTPANFGAFQAKPNEAARRGNWNDSLNFRLPDSWLAGTVELRVERTDGILACKEPSDATGPAGQCSDCRVTVTFAPAGKPKFQLTAVNYVDPAGTSFNFGVSDLDQVARILKATYPVATLDWNAAQLNWAGSVPPKEHDVTALLKTNWFADLFSSRIYYGVIPGPANSFAGVAASIPGRAASGYIPDTFFGFGRATPPHEIGHCLGRAHSVSQVAPQFCADGTSIQGKCGECAKNPPESGYFPNFFPATAPSGFATGGTTLQPHLGPMNLGEEAFVFGLDTSGLLPRVINPNTYFDVMSYCGVQNLDMWISDWTYKGLLSSINSTFGTAPQNRPEAVVANPQTYLVVRGRVDFAAGTIELLPFFRVTSSTVPPSEPTGSYLLRLLDGAGALVQEVSFEPAPFEGRGSDVPVGMFLIPVPDNPSIRQAVVMRNSTVVASRTASAHPPTVQVVFPNGGENITQDPVLLQWSGSDTDGDTLTYDVQFSADGGATWTTVVGDWPEQNYTIPRVFLKGTTAGLLRVTARDGFWSASDQSNATFTVANHAPIVSILSPTPAETFSGDQQIVLESEARDVEDGDLSGASVQWSSSIDGPVGDGSTLFLKASQLSEGTHTVTVKATDSGSLASSASVQITVGRAVPANYADLSLTQAASPDPATLGLNLLYTITVFNQGRDAASLVTVTDTLPSGAAFGSAHTSQGSCSEAGGLVTCSLGSLPDHATVTATITVIPSAVGLVHNVATVTAKEMDPVPADNTATASTHVKATGPTDLSISETDSPDPVSVSSDLAYTVSVANLGPDAAADVTMTDLLPPGTTFVSAAGTGWTCSDLSATVTCTYSMLPIGPAPNITVHVKAPTAPGSITNVVSVTAEDGDPVLANNSAMESTTVSQVTVSTIFPGSGIAGGGTAITISGSHFQTGATVTIGGATATNVGVASSSSITATTPALAPGTLNDVLVTNPDTTAGVLVKGWLADFSDVPQPYLYHGAVEKVFRAGITTGCGGGNYCPGDPVNRAAMAVFILRGEHGATFGPPAATGTVFTDVSATTFLAKWIEAFAAEKITTGCGGGKYCPADPVTRDAMAVFLLKGKNGSSFSPPAATGTVFGDVTTTTFLAKWMEELKAEGITGGCGGGNYCPTNTVTRGEMAKFIAKTFSLP